MKIYSGTTEWLAAREFSSAGIEIYVVVLSSREQFYALQMEDKILMLVVGSELYKLNRLQVSSLL